MEAPALLPLSLAECERYCSGGAGVRARSPALLREEMQEVPGNTCAGATAPGPWGSGACAGAARS